jgi:hypothetical protein
MSGVQLAYADACSCTPSGVNSATIFFPPMLVVRVFPPHTQKKNGFSHPLPKYEASISLLEEKKLIEKSILPKHDNTLFVWIEYGMLRHI